jgi:hypothetical protein
MKMSETNSTVEFEDEDQDAREFIKEDLRWLVNFVRVNFKKDFKQVKALLRETLTVI